MKKSAAQSCGRDHAPHIWAADLFTVQTLTLRTGLRRGLRGPRAPAHRPPQRDEASKRGLDLEAADRGDALRSAAALPDSRPGPELRAGTSSRRRPASESRRCSRRCGRPTRTPSRSGRSERCAASAWTTSSSSTSTTCGAFSMNTSVTTTGCDRTARSRSTHRRGGYRRGGRRWERCWSWWVGWKRTALWRDGQRLPAGTLTHLRTVLACWHERETSGLGALHCQGWGDGGRSAVPCRLLARALPYDWGSDVPADARRRVT